MAEIIKVYRQCMPKTRFIGKKYDDSDRVNGGFGDKWGEWFSNGWFGLMENQISIKLTAIYEDGDAYIGLMRWKEGEAFEYWIGMFAPEGTNIPDGFGYIDFPKTELGVCWLYGSEGDLYAKEDKCAAKLIEEGYKIIPDEKGAWWFFERYGCPRFTTPDAQGNVILDICHIIK
ncbi:MAG: hypothetical protein N2376_03875 [Clostridia bacterium]|nr:hypothetical protein [Clostridia bacterium]